MLFALSAPREIRDSGRALKRKTNETVFTLEDCMLRSRGLLALLLLLLTACANASAPASTLAVTSAATVPPTEIAATLPAATATTASSPAPTLAPLTYSFVWKLSTKHAPLLEASAGAVDARGNVYLLTASEQVVIVDPAGQVVRSFGEHGSGEGQFNYQTEISTPLYPQGTVAGADLAVGPDGTLYVADGGNFRVQAFDPAGKFLFAWGKRGQADGEFEVPWALAADRQGYVYVGDFTGTIQKFDRSGKFLARYGKGRGAGQGQFVGAVYDLETDAQGNLYAADLKSGRIQKFDAAGNFVTQWDQCGSSLLDIRGLAVDADGHVYVPTRSGQRICIFDSSGRLLARFGTEGLHDGEFLFGDVNADMVVSADGSLYVADSAGERLQKFRPD